MIDNRLIDLSIAGIQYLSALLTSTYPLKLCISINNKNIDVNQKKKMFRKDGAIVSLHLTYALASHGGLQVLMQKSNFVLRPCILKNKI